MGSEMCIRDRINAARMPNTRGATAATPSRRDRAFKSSGGQPLLLDRDAVTQQPWTTSAINAATMPIVDDTVPVRPSMRDSASAAQIGHRSQHDCGGPAFQQSTSATYQNMPDAVPLPSHDCCERVKSLINQMLVTSPINAAPMPTAVNVLQEKFSRQSDTLNDGVGRRSRRGRDHADHRRSISSGRRQPSGSRQPDRRSDRRPKDSRSAGERGRVRSRPRHSGTGDGGGGDPDDYDDPSDSSSSDENSGDDGSKGRRNFNCQDDSPCLLYTSPSPRDS